MKKILFDLSVCQPIGNSKYHGGGVYGYIVFEALANKYPQDIIAYYDDKRYLPDNIINVIKNREILVKTVKDNTISNLFICKEFKSLYSPLWSNSYFELFKLNVPIILTQHGLRALEMNRDEYEQIYTKNIIDYLKALIKKTPFYNLIQNKYFYSYRKIFLYDNIKFITVSEHSKASIEYFFPSVDTNRIKVYFSPNTSINTNSSINSEEKYYLIVSANRWLKNAYRAIQAFDRLFERHKNLKGKVIVTGVSDNSRILKGLKSRERFITKGYVKRDDLENLYKNAYALIYPSLNEGFGYPPIEVMKYGIPVIASSFASISEICGDAPLYVNPYSIDEIAIRIIELEDKKIYDHCKTKSINRYNTIYKKQESDLEELINYIMS